MSEKKEKQYVIDNARLIAEWDWKKNNELGVNPQKITNKSDKKVWWKCHKGHEWQATVGHRTRGQGCPYCSGRLAIKGENDLKTINPTLAKEWNYEKNNELTPDEVLPNCNKKVWWRCSKGHEWQATVNHRTQGRGCPICKSERKTSFPEYILVFYLKKYGLDIIHSYKDKGYELDIYIPSKQTAIEYDGHIWHKDKENKDLEKNRLCEKDGIKLYRVREWLSPLHDSSLDFIVDKNQRNLSVTLEKVLSEIVGTTITINLKRDIIAIENLREHEEKEDSIANINPVVAKEWNYEKNGKLMPENVQANSSRIVWWRCSQGHEWQASVSSRNKNHNCPYCSGRYAIVGKNDLKSINPSLAREWNYEKNGDLKPENFTIGSGKKVWWVCSHGHEWQAAIYSRNSGTGCPYCSGNKIIQGKTDLQTINPSLSKEWNYAKNLGLTPMDVSSCSDRKVWWICSKGHEWQATIGHRTQGQGCPYCSGKRVLKGFNDLLTVNPTLAKEWDYEKNGNLTPEDFTAGSGKKVWWKCSHGHEWLSTICSRNDGSVCPYCSGRLAIKGKNDLQTVNPILANEWNYEKNGNLQPEEFTTGSKKKVWWICRNGHEWQATIANRNGGNGCPYCAGKSILTGYNDLQAVNPVLSKEWNHNKNSGLLPTDVAPNSNKKVWWICSQGHEWQARIASRNCGNGCPECAKENCKKKYSNK